MKARPEVTVLAEGLLFPEGPVVFPDGSVVLVELLAGRLSRVWNGRTEVVCDLGGGPNGAALGPDGALYVCNCGGFDWSRRADGGFEVRGPLPPERGGGGRIERVNLATGRAERVYEQVEGHALSGPNDLVFDAAGGFWFTDLGLTRGRTKDQSGLYYARADGSAIVEAHFGVLSYNGVGLAPDGATLYAADTFSARLWAYDLEEPGRLRPETRRLIGTSPGDVLLDSLAVTEAGRVCVGTLQVGGVTTFGTDGATDFTPLPDPYVTNLCFGGPGRRTAYVTLSLSGRLAAVTWSEAGLRLNFSDV